jgi:hypothetical protein
MMRKAVRTRYLVVAAGIFSACLLMSMPARAADPAPAAETPAAEARVIAGMVEAYGGREALSKVKSIYARGFCNLYQQDNDGWITRYLLRPRKLRVEAAYQKDPETRILNGAKGWMGVGKAGQKEADRYAYEGLVFQYDYMNLPFSLIDGTRTVVYKGRDATGSVPVDVLHVRGGEGEEMTLYVDTVTHLVTRVSSPIAAPAGKTEVGVEFSDYRSVNGVKMPFRVVSSFGATKVGVTVMSRVEINRAMDAPLFQPGETAPGK